MKHKWHKKIRPLGVLQKGLFPDKPVKSTENKSLVSKLWLIAQNDAETYKKCLFESQILFCKRIETVGFNAINGLN